MHSLAAVVILVALGVAHAEISYSEKCPSVQIARNLNVKSIFGTWYEASRYPSDVDTTLCNQFTTRRSQGYGAFRVTFSWMWPSGEAESRIGEAYAVSSADNRATYNVRFQDDGRLSYSVLSTDADSDNSYIILYRCVQHEDSHTRYIWISTREKNDETAVAKAVEVLKEQGLETDSLMVVDHSHCEESY